MKNIYDVKVGDRLFVIHGGTLSAKNCNNEIVKVVSTPNESALICIADHDVNTQTSRDNSVGYEPSPYGDINYIYVDYRTICLNGRSIFRKIQTNKALSLFLE